MKEYMDSPRDDEPEYSPADPLDERNHSNIYHVILVGINWWNHLKAIYPKVPTTINRDLHHQV